MLPSATVENYLKVIYRCQAGTTELVSVGRVASELGVVPGTATAMVKALGESGLVTYEPYAGVRLSPAGERLALIVLRRHRLIELFLVRVMGFDWTEVHEEAETLEHAVSERLIERIDAMLGRPEVDPHGDPIPAAGGVLREESHATLLTCPLGQQVVIRRIADQGAEFLRFVEKNALMPGRELVVEARDGASDSVRLRLGDEALIVGTGAASKIHVAER